MSVTMNNKKQGTEMLRDIFHRWEELLAGMSEMQITNPQLPSALSTKDEILPPRCGQTSIWIASFSMVTGWVIARRAPRTVMRPTDRLTPS